MENLSQNTTLSFETVWAALMEDREQRKENERILNEKFAETDRIMRKYQEDYEHRMKNMEDRYGSMSNNIGSFAEEYFYNSIKKGNVNFFGKKFDEITKNLELFWQGLKDEYDIVLYNKDTVAIIEVKFKAQIEHIDKVLKKAETFKILSPHYKDYKIYLGLAAMSFKEDVEKRCKDEGIAIIKQERDAVIIIDEHLKTF